MFSRISGRIDDCRIEGKEQRMRKVKRITALLVCGATALLLSVLQAHAQLSPSAQRGQTFARTHCAQCHSIDKFTDSPLRIAPPLRELHKRYPVESLEKAFAEGIVTGHPTMPQFRLELDQIRDLIAFMETLGE
jgi:cytochrome c